MGNTLALWSADHGLSLTVCCYKKVNFLPNRHPIAPPWGRGMGYLFWILIIYASSLLCYMHAIQCTPHISRSCISRNWIYRGHMLDPIFFTPPRAQYFSQNHGNTLDPIRGRQFFTKSAHRDSLCSRFAGDNFSRNQLQPTCQCGWNSCCVMVSHDTSIVSQSRVQLIQW